MVCGKRLFVCGRADEMMDRRGRVTEKECELSTVVGRNNWGGGGCQI